MAVTLATKPKAAARAAKAPEPKPRHVPAPVPSPPKMPLFLSAPSVNNMNQGAGGVGLAPPVQSAIESSLQVKLDSVRVHTDSYAHTASRNFSARAFTYGNHIFLGQGERPTDLGLMAHEAAHVVQQQAAPRVQKWSSRESGDACEHEAHRASAAVLSGQTFPVRERTSTARVQRLGISDALNYFADHANLIPGFPMFTIVLGVNPINMTPVDRSAANILRAVVEFIPGGALITQALDNYGIFDRVGAWVEEQIHTLAMTGSAIRHAIDDFLGSLSWRDIFHLGDVWDRARRIVAGPIDRLINFARGLVDGIVRFIKDAILRPLANFASQTRGWDLLKAVLGRDPITGDPVPRTAETLIGGFMRLIGQEEVWQNIQRANAIPRAWAWFQGALDGLLGFVRQIPSMFVQALHELELADIVLLPRAFLRVGRVFAGFAVQFFSWAGQQVWNLLQIIFEVVAPGVMPYLRRAAGAFRTIVHDPIGFVRNLVRAGLQGFHQFAANFLTHLRASLISWLTGTLEGAGIYIPQGFTFLEIIKFVLSVLGLTWQNIRQKLVRRIGETAVRALEIGFDLVVTLVRDGPAAAWHRIQEHLSNLREMVMEQVMTFVRERIVQAAITRLVTSLNPAGAFIQAIIAIYNTIMFFVERLRQIAQVAAAFIDSISAIANGVITAAANRVEQTMAGLLTLVISFFARLVGLGRVSDVVVNTVNRIRAPVDTALDRVVDWIVTMAQRAGRAIVGAIRGRDERTPEEKRRDLERAQAELPSQIDSFLANDPSKLRVRLQLLVWRTRYRLTSLQLDESGEDGQFVATINPSFSIRGVSVYIGDADLLRIIIETANEVVHGSSILARERREQRAQAAQGADRPRLPASRARGIIAFASYQRARSGMTPPEAPSLVVGTDTGGRQLRVRFRRLEGQSDPNRIVTNPAPGFQPTRPYLDDPLAFGSTLPRGPQSGQTATALRGLARGQQIPRSQEAAELYATMFGQEVARHPENLAYSTMTLDIMEQQRAGLVQSLRSHPATMAGARRAQEDLRANVEEGGRLTESAEMREERQRAEERPAHTPFLAERRERSLERVQQRADDLQEARRRAVDLTTRWVRLELSAGRGPVTRTRRSFLMWIRRAVRTRLETFVRTGE